MATFTDSKTSKVWYKRLDVWLIGILLLALFLNAWGIWDAGNANAYYTAAIKSMTESWKAFWYGSLDPQNYITVDKPPVALWFDALSAKIFGVHGWSVVLPSVLFGVASSALMYFMVKPRFGVWAGRIAAFVITITPIAVADNRTNNMDATLVFFLLLAVWLLQKATKKHKLRWVFAAFAVVGVAYNVKMLEAFMILPGMLLYYFVAIKLPWKKLLAGAAILLAVLGISSFSYTMIVDATPASARPYIGSTQNNSLLDLAFGYNGTERLLGQSTGTGGAFPGMNATTTKEAASGTAVQTPFGAMDGAGTPSLRKSGAPSGAGGGGAGGAFNIGTAGPLRLFQSELGPMASWFLPAAIIGMVVGVFGTRKKKQKWLALNDKQKETLLWAGWLVPVGGFFSVASFFHPYYLDMLAAPIAALTAIAVVETVRKVKASSKKFSWGNVSGLLIVATTIALQATFAYSYYPQLTLILSALAGLVGLWWLLPFGNVRAKAALSVAVLSLFTGWWALTPTLAHQSAQIPSVGPSLLSSQSGGMGGNAGGMSSSADSKILAYTEKNQGTATYLFATTDASTAAPYIISSGKSVMALGGFNGTDPSITLTQFKQLVKEGKIKYFLAGGKGAMGGSSTGATGQISAIVKWIEANAKTVKSVSSSTTTTASTATATAGSAAQPSAGASTTQPPTGMTPPSGTAMPNGTTPPTSSTSGTNSASKTSVSFGGGESTTLYDLTSITNFN
ncbi:MAG: glycosyltransferase family 39 protein [Streptococcaceae bacterium]|jgi:4-amino-4-deoxy-L-arabinose transferase-like glycosyltransferase|nr:glycosyltransferase family 39 protein [Streptococcaceae bacterium]